MAPQDQVCIVVTQSAITVANGGRSFSRTGVIALCASDLTEKSETANDVPDDIPSVSDRQLIEAILRRTLDTYRNDPNRLKRDARREREVTRDYGGRFMWELIQNADDAASDAAGGSELIGTKGLGFKSVLEVTEAPEIYSGSFAFKFCAQEAAALLVREGISREPPSLAFELPFPSKPSADVRNLLDQGYVTAIHLPFRSSEVGEYVAQAVACIDSRFLLLSQNLSSLRVVVHGKEKVFSVAREVSGIGSGNTTLTVQEGSNRRVERWRRWSRLWFPPDVNAKRLSVAICMPVGTDGSPIALPSDESPVFTFFPTNEFLGARALIHASFDLEQNRKHFRKGAYDDQLLDEFHNLLTDVLGSVACTVALETFSGVKKESSSGLVRKLAKQVTTTLTRTEFIPIMGGGKVRPSDARIWSGRLGDVLRTDDSQVRKYALVDPSLKGSTKPLAALGATTIEPRFYIDALRFCKNASVTDTKSSFDAVFSDGLERLPQAGGWQRDECLKTMLRIPCWWMESGSARGVVGPLTMLWEGQAQWPAWLPADALSAGMRTHVGKFAQRLKREADGSPYSQAKRMWDDWKTNIEPSILRSPTDFLHQALVPAVKEWNGDKWSNSGWDALEWVAHWAGGHDFAKVQPLPYDDRSWQQAADKRTELARAIHLPTHRNWISAGKCYAGRSWDGLAYFDKLSAEGSRGILKPFRAWKWKTRRTIKKEEWKGLLRYLGVSWEPKLVRFSGRSQDSEYLRYLSEYTRLSHDWRLEYFPECLESERPASILKACYAISETIRRNFAEYFRYRKQYSETPSIFKSYAQYQLFSHQWIPHKGCLLYHKSLVRPKEAFLPGRGIPGVVPEVDLQWANDKERVEIIEWLVSVGVQYASGEDRRM